MNWIEMEIKNLQVRIDWHKKHGFSCKDLEKDLDILLKMTEK